jgi:hypothetical protein
MCSEVVCPRELPLGSAHSCRLTPVHIRLTNQQPYVEACIHVWAPPPSITCRPLAEEICHPGESQWVSAPPRRVAPFTNGPLLRPGFEMCSHAGSRLLLQVMKSSAFLVNE